MPRSRRRRRRRHRVSRSYLHLNRGLTSPLATTMNFIPLSYFWSPLWRVRGAPRGSLLSIISVAAVTRHLGAVLRTFAREEAKERSTSLRRLLSCANFASPPSLAAPPRLSLPHPVATPSQTRIPQTPPGSVKYVRDARLDAGDLPP